MRYMYLILCYFTIRSINDTLIKIVVNTGGDVQILQSHTAKELYVKMKDIYAPSIRTVSTVTEMREHYKALSDFDKILKKFSVDKK
jgi:hypothetical protein